MGLRLPQNFLRSPRFGENMQDVFASWILDIRGQLAIGKRTGTALSELNVRIGVKRTPSVKASDRFQTRIHAFSTFNDQGASASLGERPGRKQAGRARAHHHRTSRRATLKTPRTIARIRLMKLQMRRRPASAPHDIQLVRASKAESVRRDEVDVVFLARVHAALQKAHACNAQRIAPNGLRNASAHQVLPMRKTGIERKAQIAYLEHANPYRSTERTAPAAARPARIPLVQAQCRL